HDLSEPRWIRLKRCALSGTARDTGCQLRAARSVRRCAGSARKEARMSLPPLIIEVAVNGATTRDEHPRVPITQEAIVADARACAAAGASVIHVHGRTPDGGWAFDDADAHREIFAELRCDGLLVYPSMSFSTGDPVARFRHVDALGAEGLLDWAPVDTGTVYLIRCADG